MIQNIPITKIHPHPNNPRTDLGNLDELAESMKTAGILQNLTVVKDPKKKDRYIVVIGHRRLAAAKTAGLTEVPCTVAEMDEKTQIATMLLENIQRADLTVWEQAKGFQMMMDLGESQESISEKTGFSKSTVRRRLNLLDLDPVQFKASSDRGATLMDYVELEKIKDPERKNRALQAIGTNNFEWALRVEIDAEKAINVMNPYIEILKKYATEIGDQDYKDLKYLRSFYAWENQADVPEDPTEDVPHYYLISQSAKAVSLYRDWTQEEIEAQNNLENAGEEARQVEQGMLKRRAVLDEISDRAYRLRVDFVKKTRITKKQIPILLSEAVKVIWDMRDWGDLDEDGLLPLVLGMDQDIEEITEDNVLAKLQDIAPEQAIFYLRYCEIEDTSDKYYSMPYIPTPGIICRTLKYSKNEKLEALYSFLEAFGYQLSDDERSLREGTHEFLREGEEG